VPREEESAAHKSDAASVRELIIGSPSKIGNGFSAGSTRD